MNGNQGTTAVVVLGILVLFFRFSCFASDGEPQESAEPSPQLIAEATGALEQTQPPPGQEEGQFR